MHSGEERQSMKGKLHNYLSFRVGHEWYGVSVNDVIEVLHLVALNEVPASNIMGLMNPPSAIRSCLS